MSGTNPESSPAPGGFRRLLTRYSCVIAGIASALLLVLSRDHPLLVERFYTRGLYPIVSAPLAWVSGWSPVSFSEILLLGGTLFVSTWIVLGLLRLRNQPGKRRAILFGALRRTATISGLLVTLFVWLWGFNYAREPIVNRHPELAGTPSVQDWQRAATLLIESVHRDQVLMDRTGDEAGLESAVDRGLTHVLSEWDGWPRIPSARGKTPLVDAILDSTATSGVYSPFFAEVHVSGTLPRVALPFILAHEKAHRAGYADEGEASFVAFLACRASLLPSVRYSGALMLLLTFAREPLFRENGDLIDRLDPVAREDANNVRAWRTARTGWISRVESRIYDRYLKLQGRPEGIASYDRVARYVTNHLMSESTCPPH